MNKMMGQSEAKVTRPGPAKGNEGPTKGADTAKAGLSPTKVTAVESASGNSKSAVMGGKGSLMEAVKELGRQHPIGFMERGPHNGVSEPVMHKPHPYGD